MYHYSTHAVFCFAFLQAQLNDRFKKYLTDKYTYLYLHVTDTRNVYARSKVCEKILCPADPLSFGVK